MLKLQKWRSDTKQTIYWNPWAKKKFPKEHMIDILTNPSQEEIKSSVQPVQDLSEFEAAVMCSYIQKL